MTLDTKRDADNLGGHLASYLIGVPLMRTIACNECGHEIAVDDFIMECCPICDSFMVPNRLNKKVDSSIEKIIQVEHREIKWQLQTT